MKVAFPTSDILKGQVGPIIYLNHPASGRVLPKAHFEVVFNVKQPYRKYIESAKEYQFSPFSWVTGLQQAPFFIKAEGETACFIVQVKPWAVNKLFTFPGKEFTNASVNLSDVWKNETEQINEMLYECSVEQGFKLIESFLEAKMCKNINAGKQKQTIGQLQYLHQVISANNVRATCDILNVSRKHLNEICNTAFGLSPVKYRGLLRFNNALSGLAHHSKADNSLDQFFDQAHFIKDFHSYASLTPGAYKKELVAQPFPSLYFIQDR